MPPLPSLPRPPPLAARVLAAGLSAVVWPGSVLGAAADAVVSPAGQSLPDPPAGLAATIASKAGPAYADAVQALRDSGGVPPGTARVTTAGSLPPPARWVIQAVGPDCRLPAQRADALVLLGRAFRAVLDHAHRLGARRVAVPAIAAGLFQCPPQTVATAAWSALVRFSQERPPPHTPLEVVWALPSSGIADIFVTSAPPSAPPSSRGAPPPPPPPPPGSGPGGGPAAAAPAAAPPAASGSVAGAAARRRRGAPGPEIVVSTSPPPAAVVVTAPPPQPDLSRRDPVAVLPGDWRDAAAVDAPMALVVEDGTSVPAPPGLAAFWPEVFYPGGPVWVAGTAVLVVSVVTFADSAALIAACAAAAASMAAAGFTHWAAAELRSPAAAPPPPPSDGTTRIADPTLVTPQAWSEALRGSPAGIAVAVLDDGAPRVPAPFAPATPAPAWPAGVTVHTVFAAGESSLARVRRCRGVVDRLRRTQPRGARVVFDVVRLAVPLLALFVAAAGAPWYLWVDPAPLWCVPPPVAPPPEPVPVIPPSDPMSLRVCDHDCPRCDWADWHLVAGGYHPGRPPGNLPRLVAAMRALREHPSWHPHQRDVEAVPTEGVPHPESVAPSLADALAAARRYAADSPPPAIARLPDDPLLPHDAVGRVRLPWLSDARPEGLVRTRLRVDQRSRMWGELLRGVAYGHLWLPQSASYIKCSHLLFEVLRDGKTRACVEMCQVSAFLTADFAAEYGAPQLLLAPGAVAAAKADAKAAFKAIELAACDWPYLGFIVDGVGFVAVRVQFGVTHGPALWVRRLQAVMAPLLAASSAVTWVIYMDDVGWAASSVELVVIAALSLAVWWPAHGVWLAVSKFEARPMRAIKFLGLIVDFGRAALAIPPSTATKVARLAAELACLPPGTLAAAAQRQVRSFVGKVAFLMAALPIAGLLVRSMCREACGKVPFWTEASVREAAGLSRWFPTIASLVMDSALALPLLLIVCDASSPVSGGAFWVLAGVGWAVLDARTFHLADYGFPPASLTSSASFEAAAAAAAMMDADANAPARWRSAIVFTDARALACAMMRQLSTGAARLVARWRARSPDFAAALLRMASATVRDGVLRFVAFAWQRRNTGAAQLADATSDAIAGTLVLSRAARAAVLAVTGGVAIDLAAVSGASALAAAWCFAGGEVGRSALLARLLAAARAPGHPGWPAPPASVDLVPFRDAFATLGGATLALGWLRWLASALRAAPNCRWWACAPLRSTAAWRAAALAAGERRLSEAVLLDFGPGHQAAFVLGAPPREERWLLLTAWDAPGAPALEEVARSPPGAAWWGVNSLYRVPIGAAPRAYRGAPRLPLPPDVGALVQQRVAALTAPRLSSHPAGSPLPPAAVVTQVTCPMEAQPPAPSRVRPPVARWASAAPAVAPLPRRSLLARLRARARRRVVLRTQGGLRLLARQPLLVFPDGHALGWRALVSVLAAEDLGCERGSSGDEEDSAPSPGAPAGSDSFAVPDADVSSSPDRPSSGGADAAFVASLGKRAALRQTVSRGRPRKAPRWVRKQRLLFREQAAYAERRLAESPPASDRAGDPSVASGDCSGSDPSSGSGSSPPKRPPPRRVVRSRNLPALIARACARQSGDARSRPSAPSAVVGCLDLTGEPSDEGGAGGSPSVPPPPAAAAGAAAPSLGDAAPAPAGASRPAAPPVVSVGASGCLPRARGRARLALSRHAPAPARSVAVAAAPPSGDVTAGGPPGATAVARSAARAPAPTASAGGARGDQVGLGGAPRGALRACGSPPAAFPSAVARVPSPRRCRAPRRRALAGGSGSGAVTGQAPAPRARFGPPPLSVGADALVPTAPGVRRGASPSPRAPPGGPAACLRRSSSAPPPAETRPQPRQAAPQHPVSSGPRPRQPCMPPLPPRHPAPALLVWSPPPPRPWEPPECEWAWAVPAEAELTVPANSPPTVDAGTRWVRGGRCEGDGPPRKRSRAMARPVALPSVSPQRSPPRGLLPPLAVLGAQLGRAAEALDDPCPLPPAASAAGAAVSSVASSARLSSADGSHAPMPCRQCGVTIQPLHPARFCDVEGCNDWACCRRCSPEAYDARKLLCPGHQLARRQVVDAPEFASAREALESSRPGTVGRALARLLGRAEGMSSEDMAEWPRRGRPPDPGDMFAAARGASLDDLWTASRKRVVKGISIRTVRFARWMGAWHREATELPDFAHIYARRRLRDPLDGWQHPNARTVKQELSALAEALRADGGTAPQYMGPQAKRYLVLSGAFEKPGHTRSWPVSVRSLWLARERCPEQHRPALHTALFQGVACLRAGARFRWDELSPCGPGWGLRWSRATKVVRGDRLARPGAKPAVDVRPQFSVVAGEVVAECLQYARKRWPKAKPSDPIFPVTPAAVTACLRALFPSIPKRFRLSAHSVRAGSATVLMAMGVPRDIIRVMGWWARERASDGYYASASVSLMAAATSHMHRVELRPEEPGAADAILHGPPLPDWEAVRLRAADLPDVAPPKACPVVALDSDSSSDDDDDDDPLAPREVRLRRAHDDPVGFLPRLRHAAR